MLISLCMIARNEEPFIGECLRSARDAVDEIVLVDTGSTDRTVEIARSFGAKIFPFSWGDDFSAARNASLEKASGRWILVLDADERLAEGAAEVIRAAATSDLHAGYLFPLVSLLKEGKELVCLMPRLFVNHPSIRYRYLIHEQMLPDLKHHARRIGRTLDRLPARIIHSGYLPEVMQDRGKIERNRRIFEKQLRLFPRDAYSWYKYAEFLRLSEAPREEVALACRRAYTLLREMPDDKVRDYPFAGEVAALLALEVLEAGEALEEADTILSEGAERFTATPHIYYVKGGVEKALGRHREAIASYRRCLELHGKIFMVPVTEGATSWSALNGMGDCYLEMGDHLSARLSYERSIRARPSQVEPYAGLSEAAYRAGNLRDALQGLEDLLEVKPDHEPAWRAGSEILERMGLTTEARRWRKRAGKKVDKAKV